MCNFSQFSFSSYLLDENIILTYKHMDILHIERGKWDINSCTNAGLYSNDDGLRLCDMSRTETPQKGKNDKVDSD